MVTRLQSSITPLLFNAAHVRLTRFSRNASKQSQPNPAKVFGVLDVRVGKIREVKQHPKSFRLFCEEIDVGEDSPRMICSRLREDYTDYELTTRYDGHVLVLCNYIEERIGIKSSGKVVCAQGADGEREPIRAPAGSVAGDKVFIEGVKRRPAKTKKIMKQNLWNKLSRRFEIDEKTGIVSFRDGVLSTSHGPCKLRRVRKGSIK